MTKYKQIACISLAFMAILAVISCGGGGGGGNGSPTGSGGGSGGGSVPMPPDFKVIEAQQVEDLPPQVAPPYVTTRQRVNLSKNWDEVVLLNPAGDAWPGAIVSAKSLVDGSPQPIPVERKPIEVTVIGLGLSDNVRVVDDPWSGSVESAVNDILQNNLDNGMHPAQISSEYTEAFSSEQVAFMSGLSTKDDLFSIFSLGIGFDFSKEGDRSQEKRRIVFKVTQNYYKVQVRLRETYRDYVAEGTPFSSLMKYLPSNDYPAMIREVTYGRILLYEMISSKGTSVEKMKAAFKASIFKSATLTEELKKVWEQSEVRVLVLGGGAPAVIAPADPAELYASGAKWSKDSPGFPLIYKSNLLADGLPQFAFGRTTEFTTYNSTLQQGDNKWRVFSFGRDYTHHNNFKMERDGSPVASNPALPPGGPWGNRSSLGGNAGGPGSIAVSFPKDHQVYGDTWLFAEHDTVVSGVQLSANVGRVWFNNVEITQNPMSFLLKGGVPGHLEFVCYNQNDTARLTIQTALATMVDAMDSQKFEGQSNLVRHPSEPVGLRPLWNSGTPLDQLAEPRWTQPARLRASEQKDLRTKSKKG